MELVHEMDKGAKVNMYIFAIFQLKPVSQGNVTFDLCLTSDLNPKTNDFFSELFDKGYLIR